jgi:hypothetical protein
MAPLAIVLARAVARTAGGRAVLKNIANPEDSFSLGD